MITFGSLFAGIRGFDLGLTRAGMSSAFAAEINAECNSVARRHFPDEVQFDDVTAVSGSGGRADVICAGWPCQGNSVAGRRAGMADERSGLWWEVVRILAEQRPRWFVGENVPGVLSVNGGRDFGAILWSLAELGYGFAYRVLDAQWFGVAQRRRRVVIVGYLGDWKRPAEILFERESLPWHSPPRRKKGAKAAGRVGTGAAIGSGLPDVAYSVTTRECQRLGDCQYTLIAYAPDVTHPLTAEGLDASEDGTGRGTPIIAYQCHGSNVGPMGTLRAGNGNAGGGVPFIASDYRNGDFEQSTLARPLTTSPDRSRAAPIVAHPFVDVAYSIVANGNGTDPAGHNQGWNSTYIGQNRGVRRLMPIECERLQGFPDGWTSHGADGKEISEGARYRMLGNAVAVPVFEWIGRRIVENEARPCPT